jgi:hypothetical protein
MIVRVYQKSETNVMHVLFGLLRINGFYMFRALLAHPLEAITNGTWYTKCVLCHLAATRVGKQFHSNPGSGQLTQHVRNISSAVCVQPPEDEEVMFETCRGPSLLIN